MAWRPGDHWWEYWIPGWGYFAAISKGIRTLSGEEGKRNTENNIAKYAEAMAQANAANVNFTNDTNAMNIANQNYWNERYVDLANTAHQREVRDLEAAGLNKWLSASGAGASSTALSTATAQAPEVDSTISSSAISAMAMLAISNQQVMGKIVSSALGLASKK